MTVAVDVQRVSNLWKHRPDDGQFSTLKDLHNFTENRKSQSWTAASRMADLSIMDDNGDLKVKVFDPTAREERILEPTNYGFNQLAQYASAPAGYLRTLHPQLAAINLQYGLEVQPKNQDGLIFAQSNGEHHLRSITSQTYGRIYDSEAVQSVIETVDESIWSVPASMPNSGAINRATKLYASDRDLYLFMINRGMPLDIPGEKSESYLGFYISNSEVGYGTFEVGQFIYRASCANRAIWAISDLLSIVIRHTKGAPERFKYEGRKFLENYAKLDPTSAINQIVKARQKELDVDRTKPNNQGFVEWLQNRGFAKKEAEMSINSALQEEGTLGNLWSIINGITAYARSIPHTDSRTSLESRAGKLMKLVA
jgi:hypothetical protein